MKIRGFLNENYKHFYFFCDVDLLIIFIYTMYPKSLVSLYCVSIQLYVQDVQYENYKRLTFFNMDAGCFYTVCPGSSDPI